jgi:hypothetical protein
MRRFFRRTSAHDYFDACVARFLQAQERAATAGLRVEYAHDEYMHRAWTFVTDNTPVTRPLGHVLVSIVYGLDVAQPHLYIAQSVLERASVEEPAPLLATVQAIDRATRDYLAHNLLAISFPYHTYMSAYVQSRNQILGFGLREEARPESSAARWLARTLATPRFYLHASKRAVIRLRTSLGPAPSQDRRPESA